MVEYSRSGATIPAPPNYTPASLRKRPAPDHASNSWLFLLFFAANYQPSTSRFPQKSWPAGGSANEKQPTVPLHSAVFRCFCK